MPSSHTSTPITLSPLPHYLYRIKLKYMKNFFNTLLLWGLLILSCGLFYLAVTVSFPSAFVNIALLISAVFTLGQSLGIIDKRNGFGKGNDDK